MDLSVADELERWGQQLIPLVPKVELRLVTVNAMEWQFAQLPTALFLHGLVFAEDVALDRHVVLEILADDAWRNFADQTFQSDVLGEGWLKVLDNARLADLQAREIDYSQA